MKERYLTKEEADMFIKERDDLIELYGSEIFYKIAATIQLGMVSERRTVENDCEQYFEFVNAGYTILRKDVDFKRLEEKELGSWHCTRKVLCKGTQFLTPCRKSTEVGMYELCFREFAPEIHEWGKKRLNFVYNGRDFRDGLIFIGDPGEAYCGSVRGPIRALLNNDYEEIVRCHTDYTNKYYSKRRKWKRVNDGRIEEQLGLLNSPFMLELKKILADRKAVCNNT